MLSTLVSLTLVSPVPSDVDFLKDVYPIFEAHCIECHGPKKQKGGDRERTRLYSSLVVIAYAVFCLK